MRRILSWRGQAWLGRKLGRKLAITTWREHWYSLISNRKLYGHIHYPLGEGPFPGLVLVPGGASPGTDYDKGWRVRASDLAGLGFAVVHYDPSGRGRSGGSEDHWGAAQQDELAQVIEQSLSLPEIAARPLGIVSFSIGISIASGCLARNPELNVGYLFDWEGPSNSQNATLNDTHPPLAPFPSSNREFWAEREAVAQIGQIRCGYFRYQAQLDHVQGRFKGHAIELLNAATQGRASWSRCNDNPENILYDPKDPDLYSWIEPGRDNKAEFLGYLLAAARRAGQIAEDKPRLRC